MNKELLNNWFEHGLMSFNGKKAEWTRKAKKLVPGSVRQILTAVANGKKVYRTDEFKLALNHFDKKGFYRGNDKKTGS